MTKNTLQAHVTLTALTKALKVSKMEQLLREREEQAKRTAALVAGKTVTYKL